MAGSTVESPTRSRNIVPFGPGRSRRNRHLSGPNRGKCPLPVQWVGALGLVARPPAPLTGISVLAGIWDFEAGWVRLRSTGHCGWKPGLPLRSTTVPQWAAVSPHLTPAPHGRSTNRRSGRECRARPDGFRRRSDRLAARSFRTVRLGRFSRTSGTRGSQERREQDETDSGCSSHCQRPRFPRAPPGGGGGGQAADSHAPLTTFEL